jgi:tight adherence protein C
VVRVTGLAIAAVPAGIGLGLGLWTLVALLPRLGAPRLGARIAPYLLDVSPEARRLVRRQPLEPASVLGGLLAPVAVRARGLLGGALGGDAAVEQRLRQAGSTLDLPGFRSRQLVWAAVGAVGSIATLALLGRTTSVSPPVAVVLVALATVGGLLAPEQLLARRARARLARIASELPTVLEFLTLSLSAGEGLLDAVRRVARTGSGELARELGGVVARVNSGIPLADALTGSATSIGLPALSRAVDQLVGALDRGTPLTGALRAQAQDCRDDAKRALLETAGKKEVAMLVPLVFGVLPVTIAFAIFPATLVLRLGF